MPTHQIGDHRIDELSQRILSVLVDLSESETPRIVDELDAKPQSVHYRLKTHLRPAGLVQRLGQDVDDDSPDAAEPAVAWRITAAGREFVEERDVAEAASAQAAVEATDRLRGRVEEFSERLAAVDDRLEGWQDTMDDRAGRLNDIEGTADDAVDDAEKAVDTASSNATAISSLQDDLDDLSDDLDDLEDEVDNLKDDRERHAQNAAKEFRHLRNQVGKARRKALEANNRGLLEVIFD